jgi:hypothetical protein
VSGEVTPVTAVSVALLPLHLLPQMVPAPLTPATTPTMATVMMAALAQTIPCVTLEPMSVTAMV